MKTLTEVERTNKKWVDFGRYPDEPCFSKSGKAIYLELPITSHGGNSNDVWIPVSLCRLVYSPTFGDTIFVPMWFCLQNSIHF